ncbi:ATP-dependent nuclease [Clostridium botulinum]|uniref:ATP-dependent nuclease n=1 Tax=Clostridium botulinum TaxID=1491 RepID=UPI003DA5B04C
MRSGIMYISNITIENYRSFKNISVDFHEGVNVLIGHNNAGKSNLLKALAIIFDSSARKQLAIDDFNKNISMETLKTRPPKIIITVLLTQSTNENLMGDELVTVSNWLTKLEEPYQAKLQYEFFLPSRDAEKYINKVKDLDTKEKIWSLIRSEFLRLYINKIWIGNPENQITIDSESLSKFDFQFLDAIRDVERDMFSGKNTLLKNVIDFFIDYDIKSDKKITEENQKEEIQKRKDDFADVADNLVEKLRKRLNSGNREILSYADDIGASFDKSKPNFEGSITESELYSVLQLIVQQETGMKIPISHNGLGYNNLIFMSLLLAKMQVDSDGKYLGSNAKVFPILAIEEPEAHLHPTMQYQFIKFLKKNINSKKVKQVFITSHSTHITAATSLDDIICFYDNDGLVNVAYPGKVFTLKDQNNTEIIQSNSKKYVQRFFDATKSNMLFSEKVILVEGIAEQLLIPVFANYIGKSLEEEHVAVINVGGRYFEHFLYMFNSNNKFAINRKIACITDLDPTRRLKNNENKNSNKFKVCYPYEFNVDNNKFEYKYNQLMDTYEEGKHPNIRAYVQPKKYGKTLEYQLIIENPSAKILITPSISNLKELINLMNLYLAEKTLEELIKQLHSSEENTRIIKSLCDSDDSWSDDDKKKALIASRYLNSVGKGENALELASALKDNLELKGKEGYEEFNVPKYIAKSIEWVCD